MRFLIVLALLCPILSFSQQNRSKPPAPLSPVNGQRSTLNPSPPSSVISHLLSSPSTVNSQRSSLTIGDTLPVEVFRLLQSTGAGSALSLPGGGRGEAKLLILDFWATWCGACLRTFPHLDTLQQQFSPNLNLLLVSTVQAGDNPETVRAFFEKHRRPSGTKYQFPLLLNDTVLGRLFPHNLIPHYVWIRNNKVLAITSFEELTAANIRSALSGATLRLRQKWEATDYKPGLPLLQSGNGGPATSLRLQSTLSAFLPGFNPGVRKWSDSAILKITCFNQHLSWLYQYATRLPLNRIHVEGNDTQPGADSLLSDTARYCFELSVPAGTPEAAWRRAMVRQLSAAFGLYGSWQKRSLSCWVLVQTAAAPTRPFAQNPAEGTFTFSMTQGPLSQLAAALNNSAGAAAPIVLNETGTATRYTITLHASLTNLPALRKELAPYGLELVPAIRLLNVFVLSDAPPDHSPTNPGQNHPSPNENEQPQTTKAKTNNQ